VGALFGLGLGEGEVGWASGMRVPGRHIHGALQSDLEALPHWCHRPYAQAVTRSLLADALYDFRAAFAGARTSEWRPSPDTWPSWSLEDGVLTLRGVVKIDAIESVVGLEHPPLSARTVFWHSDQPLTPLHQVSE
jgi:hypothetical protein